MRNKPVLSRKVPPNIYYSIVFYGVKIFTIHAESRIHSKVDGTFICSVDKNKLYALSALCGVLSMCFSIFMMRALFNGSNLIPVVAALLLLLFASIVSYILFKIMLLIVCKKQKNRFKQNKSTISSYDDVNIEEDKRIGFMVFAGAMILFNILVLIF